MKQKKIYPRKKEMIEMHTVTYIKDKGSLLLDFFDDVFWLLDSEVEMAEETVT